MSRQDKIKALEEQLRQIGQQLIQQSPVAQRLIGQLEGLRELESEDAKAKEEEA